MSRYQPRHARPQPVRRPVHALAVAAGLSGVLALPLAAAPAAAHSTGAASSTSRAAAGMIAEGAQGRTVVLMQRLLGVRADGDFGPITRRAVVAFQGSAGLPATGVIDKRTRSALVAAPRAARSTTATVKASRSAARDTAPDRLLAEAARHEGKPYRYGSDGPDSFDCSGFVQYVHHQIGIDLPRTSGAQAAAATPVDRADRRPGDLIIIRSGGRVSHVGIYAGENTMWVARRTGTTITRQALWTSNYSVGRFT